MCTGVSLKLLALGKRFGNEYLRPFMLSELNMVDTSMCLLPSLGDEIERFYLFSQTFFVVGT
jgi:hypothetical protein